MPPDTASIDRCENCRYWEEIQRQDKRPQKPHADGAVGLCHIITTPARFRNDIATIGNSGAFLPRARFHCTLYKVGKAKR